MKFKNIDKKYITKSIILRSISVLLYALILVVTIFAIPKDVMELWVTGVSFVGLLLLFSIIYAYVFPTLQYKKYLYLVKEDEIVIMKGVLFKKSVVIPVVQIQDIGYSAGPISQIFKVVNVEISTAGSNHFILSITEEDAKTIVDSVKEKIKEYKEKGIK